MIVTVIGCILLAMVCVGYAAESLDDKPADVPQRDLSWLLFALCLIGVLSHAKKTKDESHDE